MFALLTLITLAAAPVADAGVDDSAPVESAPAFELVIPEKMLQDLLEAAAPFDRDIKRSVQVMGFSQDVTVSVRLSKPKVAISPSGVRVTMNYALASGSGLIGTSGVITPRLELKPDAKTGDLVARMVDASMSSTGVSVPLEDVVDPIHIPASTNGPLDVGGRNVDASAKITRVALDDKTIHVFGSWTFKPVAKKGAR